MDSGTPVHILLVPPMMGMGRPIFARRITTSLPRINTEKRLDAKGVSSLVKVLSGRPTVREHVKVSALLR